MSSFVCPSCKSPHPIFGPLAKIRERCAENEIRILGEIPLDSSICEDADRGKPTVVAAPEGSQARVFEDIATAVEKSINLRDEKGH